MRTLALGLLVILAGCATQTDKVSRLAPPPPKKPSEIIKEKDYGNLIFYFPNDYDAHWDFGKKLSAFMDMHPDLKVVTITGSGGGYKDGKNYGYYVVFEPKSKDQDNEN